MLKPQRLFEFKINAIGAFYVRVLALLLSKTVNKRSLSVCLPFYQTKVWLGTPLAQAQKQEKQ